MSLWKTTTAILLCVGGWLGPLAATADVIVFKDATKDVVYGRIVRQSDSATTIAVVSKTAGEPPRRVEISNEQIELVVRNFDEQRLCGLSPSNLADYQNYAFELAAQQADPVARDLAVRLHMIVVGEANENQALDRSMKLASLRQLVEVARNEKERSEFELLLKLEVGGSTGNQESVKRDDALKLSDTDNAAVVNVIQLIRRNKQAAALEELAKPAVAKLFQPWLRILSADEVRRIAGLSRLGRSDLQKLLTVELAISRGDSPERAIAGLAASSATPDWDALARKSGPELKLPRLATINEIDPRQNVYRDGKWVRR